MPLDVVVWDASLSQQPDHPVLLQRGCPIGFFAQIVPLDAPGSQPIPAGLGSPDNAIRCRLMATTTPDSLASESASFAEEAWMLLGQITAPLGTIGAALGSGTTWLLLGLAAFFFLDRRR